MIGSTAICPAKAPSTSTTKGIASASLARRVWRRRKTGKVLSVSPPPAGRVASQGASRSLSASRSSFQGFSSSARSSRTATRGRPGDLAAPDAGPSWDPSGSRRTGHVKRAGVPAPSSRPATARRSSPPRESAGVVGAESDIRRPVEGSGGCRRPLRCSCPRARRRWRWPRTGRAVGPCPAASSARRGIRGRAIR